MADSEKKVLITAEFNNKTHAGFQQVQKDTQALEKSSAGLGQTILGTAGGFVAAQAAMMATRVATEALNKGFNLLLDTLEAGAQLQMTNTALEVIAENAKISKEELAGMRQELANINTFGQAATNVLKQFIQTGMYELVDSVQWASGKQGFEGFIETVKDFGAAMGVSSKQAINDFTLSIASLQPELLANYNITSDLNDVYTQWANTHGMAGQQLDETQKRLALLNLVATEGADVAGVYGATYETVGKNLLSIADAATSVKEELGVSMMPLIEGSVGETLNLLQEFNKYVIENGETLAIFFEDLSTMFNFLQQDLIDFKNEGSNFDAIIIGLGNIAKAVALTISGFKVLAGTVELFYNAIKTMYAPVVGAIGAIASAIERALAGDWEGVVSAVEIMPEALGDAFGDLEQSFNDVAMDAADFNEIWNTNVTDAFNEAQQAAQATAREFPAVGAGYSAMAHSIQNDAKKTADAIAKFNDQLRNMVIQHRERLDDLKQQLKDLNAEIKDAIDERVKDAKHEEEAIVRSSELKIKRLQQEIDLERERGSAANEERIKGLQDAIDAEMALRKKRLGDLQSDLDAEKNAIKEKHKDEFDELNAEIKKEQDIQKNYAWAFTKFKDAQEIDDITRLLQGFFAQYGFIPKAQAGMNSSSGGLALVGERGAELVSLPRGAKVHSTEETKGMMGNTFNFYIGGVYGVDNLQRVIMDTVNRSTASQNNLARYNVL